MLPSLIVSFRRSKRWRASRVRQDVEKYRDVKILWRIRVGAYRVIYSVDDEQMIVDIVAVRHRSRAYR